MRLMDMIKVEIFSQGEEVISGQTADTNAAWLSQKLVGLGFQVSRHTAVGDDLLALAGLLEEISTRAQCCICTGGLGPTVDDLTSEAVAHAFERPLVLDLEALSQIEGYFQRAGRSMTDSNRKQALLPQGAERLNNDWGTAPGFSVKHKQCLFFFLPGVPYEMRNMFRERVNSVLKIEFSLTPGSLITLRSIGMGESTLQDKLNTLSWPDEVKLGFRTMMPEVQTKLWFPPGYDEQLLQTMVGQVETAIGSAVFSIEGVGQVGGDLTTIVGNLLTERKQTLALAETFSAGYMAIQCNDPNWFKGSLITLNAEQLCKQLGLSESKGMTESVVWERTEQLATAICQEFNTDYGIVQITIENHHTKVDSSGTIRVYFVLATPQGFERGHYDAHGNTMRKQVMAAAMALDLLRRYLE